MTGTDSPRRRPAGAVALEDLEQVIGFVFAGMSRTLEPGHPGDEPITGAVVDIAASIQGPVEGSKRTRASPEPPAVPSAPAPQP